MLEEIQLLIAHGCPIGASDIARYGRAMATVSEASAALRRRSLQAYKRFTDRFPDSFHAEESHCGTTYGEAVLH